MFRGFKARGRQYRCSCETKSSRGEYTPRDTSRPQILEYMNFYGRDPLKSAGMEHRQAAWESCKDSSGRSASIWPNRTTAVEYPGVHGHILGSAVGKRVPKTAQRAALQGVHKSTSASLAGSRIGQTCKVIWRADR